MKNIFYDYTYRDYFLAKMKDNSLVVIFKAYGKSSPLQDEFENLIDVNSIEREANSKEYYDYFTQRGVKPRALCSRWRNKFKPIYKVLESNNNYDPQPIIVTLGHSSFPNGHGMAIYNYTFDFKNNSLLSKTKEEPKQYPSIHCDESCYYHCTQGGSQPPDCEQEEPKQELERGITITNVDEKETLEEVCDKVLNYLYPNCKKEMSNLQYTNSINSLKSIAKWQAKKLYSEEEVCDFVEWMNLHYRALEHTISFKDARGTRELLKQFKKNKLNNK
jgi:hypothetical protein